MNLGLKILRTATITLAVVIGLPVLLFFWSNAQWIRQDIRVDTGEIREVREGVLWDSSPTNIHDTVVTPVLNKYGIGMKGQEDPWVFFNRVHDGARMGGDWPLEKMLFSHESHDFTHIHYGDFLDAIAQYRNPQEAALWWKSLTTPANHWRRTQINRALGFHDVLTSQSNPFTSKSEFDAWYSPLMADFHNEPSRAKFIPLFDDIYALYSAPPPQP